MKVNRSHMIRLNTTPEQEVYFRKACGVARHASHRAPARWKDYRAQGKWVKMNDLKAEYNQIEAEQFPWVYEVTKCAPEQEFANLGQAFDNYWRMKLERRHHGRNGSSPFANRCPGSGFIGTQIRPARAERSGPFEGETVCCEAGTTVL